MDPLAKLEKNGIYISNRDIEYIVNKFNIKELSIFGSCIRDDFNKNSDIDLIVVFNESERISLFDLMEIQEYFETLVKRDVDIVEPDSLHNPYRRKTILDSKEIIYAA